MKVNKQSDFQKCPCVVCSRLEIIDVISIAALPACTTYAGNDAVLTQVRATGNH